ncbi:hypothetical protein BU23DRAFT_657633 [Bimuria novae-zelandiae CBS 107.79]|uniref:BTB domain-containing protein n=1 Tax=Bimuria novae-zelandiae CBS 107.79 TaxID=1447943 RepID=A0A6A5UTF6_9PLEO|nr:hypothetical protein BU23DRAFT_657633 [Bimuria novae-zelandiae CBS 107.79]
MDAIFDSGLSLAYQVSNNHSPVHRHLFETSEYSDLTITCAGETFKVHKAIVCPQSQFLEIAMKFGGKEEAEGIIDLPADDLGDVKRMLKWMYMGVHGRKSFSRTKLPDSEILLRIDWSYTFAPGRLEQSVRRRLVGAIYGTSATALRELKDELRESANAHVLSRTRRLAKYGEIFEIPASSITSANVETVFRILELPGDTDSSSPPEPAESAWSVAIVVHGDSRLFKEAGLYCIADKYDVPMLAAISFAYLLNAIKKMPWVEEVPSIAAYLLDNTPTRDKYIHFLVAEYLIKDMELCGLRDCVRDFLVEYPEMNDYCHRLQYCEDSKTGWDKVTKLAEWITVKRDEAATLKRMGKREIGAI